MYLWYQYFNRSRRKIVETMNFIFVIFVALYFVWVLFAFTTFIVRFDNYKDIENYKKKTLEDGWKVKHIILLLLFLIPLTTLYLLEQVCKGYNRIKPSIVSFLDKPLTNRKKG